MPSLKEIVESGNWDSNRQLHAKVVIDDATEIDCIAAINTDHQSVFFCRDTRLADEYATARLEINDHAAPAIYESLSISNVKRCIAPAVTHWHFDINWP